MKIPLDEALETTQMIVPEINLGINKKNDDQIQIFPVPLNFWHLYLNAIENASDMLLNELARLPDVEPVNELEAIAEDINCLISSFNIFYMCTMEEISKHLNKPIPKNMHRFQRYRKNRELEN